MHFFSPSAFLFLLCTPSLPSAFLSSAIMELGLHWGLEESTGALLYSSLHCFFPHCIPPLSDVFLRYAVHSFVPQCIPPLHSAFLHSPAHFSIPKTSFLRLLELIINNAIPNLSCLLQHRLDYHTEVDYYPLHDVTHE